MTAELAAQRRLQRRVDAGRGAWIAWVPVVGFALSALGLAAARQLARAGTPLGGLRESVLWFGALYFGVALAMLLAFPLRVRPRIVPCFRQPLEPYGGACTAAFRGGHALYRELEALDGLARGDGVEPLSGFGFADDYYGQEIRWHAASAGLRTVVALSARPAGTLAPDVVADLAGLAGALSVAAARGVGFCLMLRLYRGDLQVASSREEREGRFW